VQRFRISVSGGLQQAGLAQGMRDTPQALPQVSVASPVGRITRGLIERGAHIVGVANTFGLAG
jgi:hypothetical protein